MLLLLLLVSSAFLVGMASGPKFCLPFLVGVAAVGLPSAVGSRGWSLGLMATSPRLAGLGVVLAALWPAVVGGSPPVASVSWERALLLWTEQPGDLSRVSRSLEQGLEALARSIPT